MSDDALRMQQSRTDARCDAKAVASVALHCAHHRCDSNVASMMSTERTASTSASASASHRIRLDSAHDYDTAYDTALTAEFNDTQVGTHSCAVTARRIHGMAVIPFVREIGVVGNHSALSIELSQQRDAIRPCYRHGRYPRIVSIDVRQNLACSSSISEVSGRRS